MKRRDFLAASAVLTLLAGSPAQAAKNQSPPKAPAKAAKKPPAKPVASKTAKAKSAPDESEEMPPGEAPPRNAISLPDEPLAQWRNYDIRSTIVLNNPQGKARVWLPLVQYRDTPWERSLGHHWQGNFETAGIYRDPVADMEVFYADWSEGIAEPKLEIVSQIATQDRHFDITRRGAMAERTEILRRCLHSTQLVPNDGVMRRTAERAVGRIRDPLAQGKAIYDWVVENTIYDPGMQSVGHAHIGRLLESGNLVGRSTEISLLFVGLCRAVGIPARPVFGLRMDGSRLFSSLGASGDLSTAQHCRAEFYSPGYGWIPVNPSDVRKAIQSEGLSHADPKLTVLKKLLFGFWEMNWVSFNAAQDVELRGSAGNALPFLINPVLETREGRFDDPAAGRFGYSVTAQRV
ncbi:MAG: transglutaminase-like domain-containing protein [Propionivibrio sp.]